MGPPPVGLHVPMPFHEEPLSLEGDTFDAADWRATTRALQRIARRVVREAAGAEDIVQSAWVTALQNEERSPRRGWLRRLVRSRSVDARRRVQGRPVHGVLSDQAPDGNSASAEELASRIEVQRAVLDAVEELKEHHRVTIYLRHFDGLSIREIAKRTGVPLKTAETRLTRAHGELRAKLSRRLGADQDRCWVPALLAFAAPDLRAAVPETAAALTGPTLLLAPLLMKKLALSAAAILVVLSGWFAIDSFRTEPELGRQADGGTAAETTDDTLELAQVGLDGTSGRVATGTDSPEPATEPTASETPVHHGGLEVSVRWSDGSAAAGVDVLATSEQGRSGVSRRIQIRTDSRGLARFGDLQPASYALSTLWTRQMDSDSVKAAVEAGATARATIEIPEGVQVEGVVIDGDGDAVPGAEVWILSRLGGWASGGAVTSADSSGRFALSNVPATVSLGALAPGHTPGPPVDLDLVDTAVPPVQLELVVVAARTGGALEGRVVDDEGSPVEGAVIVAGEKIGETQYRMNDTTSESWPRRYTTSDSEGRFLIESVRVGDAPVQVRAAGFAQWADTVEVGAESTTSLEIQLDPGAVVRGRVTDADGAPVQYARVHAFPEALREDFLQGGQIDHFGPFAPEVAVTDAEGRYTLHHLRRQTMHLYAMEPCRKRTALEELFQYTRTALDLSGEGPHTWDPVLSDGRVIEGVVRYQDGTPMENLFVSADAMDSDDPHRRAVHSADGSFKFIQLPGKSYRIRAQIWDLPEGHQEPRLTGVVPGGDPIDLVATFDPPKAYPASKILLRFEDAADRALGGKVSVILERLDHLSWHFGDEGEDGVWTFTHDEPSRLRPLALLGERVIAVGETFDFVPGTDHDLGILRSQPGGTLLLNWTLLEGFDPGSIKAFVSSDAAEQTEQMALDPTRTVRLESLEPGPGKITVFADNALDFEASFVVTPDQETTLDVALTPAVGVPYHIDLPRFEEAVSIAIRFVDSATNTELQSSVFEDLGRYPNPIRWTRKLVPGTYRLEVELGNGTRKETTFQVESLDPDAVPEVALDLR